MDCFVGATTGALKSISLRDSSFTNLNPINSLKPKNDEITAMCWNGADQTEVLTGQMDRQLKLFDTVNGTYSTLFTVDGGEGGIKGLHITNDEDIVTGVASGAVRVWSRQGKSKGELEIGQDVHIVRGEGQRLASGGKENPLKVHDLATLQQTFIAKNVPPDKLELRVAEWVNDVRFMNDQRCLVTGTGTHELRIYDPRAQRRPVKQFEWLEEPITALALAPADRPQQVFAGNTRGEMGLFDLRNKPTVMCKYKGFAGAIRSLEAHPTAPFVASCGIDRFVRVHDVQTRKLVNKVYCKAQLNKILLRDDLSLLNKVKKEDVKEEEDWEKLKVGEEESSTDDDKSDSSGEDDPWQGIEANKRNAKKPTVVIKEEVDVESDSDDDEPQPKKRRKVVEKTKATRKPQKRKDESEDKETSPEPRKKKKVLKLKRSRGENILNSPQRKRKEVEA